MTDNIITFNGETRHDLPPDQILETAKGALQECVVIGTDHEGEIYVAGSSGKAAEVVYLLNVAIYRMMKFTDFED